MSLASSLGVPVGRRWSTATESFRPFSASLSSHSETRLQKPKLFLSSQNDISTSISPSGWIASANTKQVRLYNAKEANRSQEIRPRITFNVERLAKHEEIRAIALSEDLLAIATHRRLLIYDDYQRTDNLAGHLVEERHIDQNGCWTPRSMSISQSGTSATGDGATANVAVGGEGENGITVFGYIHKNCWNPQDIRLILKCPRNNGAIKSIGFSSDRAATIHGTLAFALTTGNQSYCWIIVKSSRAGVHNAQPIWHLDCKPTISQRSFRDEISSASMIVSPSGRPYILCTVDHKHGSHLPPTFIVPVDILEKDPSTLRRKMKAIRGEMDDSNTLAGIASKNGRFVVVVEKSGKTATVKLLSLQSAQGGGLACASREETWEANLKDINGDASGVSISIEEERGALEIIVVDGRGHISFARISVPDMPAGVQRLSFPQPSNHELPYSVPLRELSSGESSRRSVATFEHPDRIEIIPG